MLTISTSGIVKLVYALELGMDRHKVLLSSFKRTYLIFTILFIKFGIDVEQSVNRSITFKTHKVGQNTP